MIKRREARETHDEERKHQAGKHFPEERRAKRLAGIRKSSLETRPPMPAHAAIDRHGTQCPTHRCAGGQRPRQPQNITALSSQVWLARVCRE